MYYPLSQITTNLYTNGEEFILASNKTPYKGYYWKNSKGEFFTGKTPQDLPNEPILRITVNIRVSDETNMSSYYDTTDMNVDYLSLKKLDTPGLPPTYSPNIPTINDYKNGEYTRYFCKKSNEFIYLEISKDTYDKLLSKDSSILYNYYFPFSINWVLTGDKNDVYKVNRNITILAMKQINLPKFDLYLQSDYLKYYK